MQVTPEEPGKAWGGSQQPDRGRGAKAASLPTAPRTRTVMGGKAGKEGQSLQP